MSKYMRKIIIGLSLSIIAVLSGIGYFAYKIQGAGAFPVYNSSGSFTERADILEFANDKVIRVLEDNATSTFTDMLAFINVADNISSFQMTTASSTMAAPVFEVVSGEANKDFIIRAKGAGYLRFESNVQVDAQNIKANYLNDGADGSFVYLFHDTASPETGDSVGDVRFQSKDSLANDTTYANISTFITASTDGAEIGEMNFEVITAGVEETNYFQLGSNLIRANQKINFKGGVQYNFFDVATTTETIVPDDHFVGVSYGLATTTLTIETAACYEGNEIVIKDTAGSATTYNVVVETEGAETIDGANTYTITSNYDSISMFCDGANWFTF